MKYIEKYLDYLKVVKKYSNKTILSYYDDLIEYNEFLGNNFKNILNIDIDITKEYLKYLYERGINKNSISRKLSSIRGFYNYLVKEEILTSSPFNSIPNPKKDLYLPKFLNDKELNKIFSVCSENTPSDERDTLIIELLYATGIRVSELVNIKVKDIDRTNKSIKVLGKGDKERMVYFDARTKIHLQNYLNSRVDTNNALFVSLSLICIEPLVQSSQTTLTVPASIVLDGRAALLVVPSGKYHVRLSALIIDQSNKPPECLI